MKLYESKDPTFIDNVVIATNNQNSIGSRDLHANDEVQQLIQRKISEDFGLFYERKRGEAKSANVPKPDIVSLEKAGQAYLAIFKSQPTVSRAQKYKIYSQELYNDVFSKSQPWQLAVAHEIYRYADYQGRKAYRELAPDNPSRNILNYGVFHICRIVWWALIHELGADPRDDKALMQIARDDSGLLHVAYERANEIMSTIVDENNESLINLNNYFKKSQSQQNINQYLKKLQDQSS